MATVLRRNVAVQNPVIELTKATSSPIVLNGFSIGMVILPGTFDGTAITFTVCDTIGGTYVGYEDASGAAVTLVVEASKAYALPEGLFGAAYCKIVSGTNQTTSDTTLTVMLKP